MIKVMFREDYCGVETDNKAYKAGDIADIDDVWFERLIQDKRAVVVNPIPKRRGKTKKEE